MQRRKTPAVDRRQAGATANQESHELHVTCLRCPMENRAAPVIRSMGINAKIIETTVCRRSPCLEGSIDKRLLIDVEIANPSNHGKPLLQDDFLPVFRFLWALFGGHIVARG